MEESSQTNQSKRRQWTPEEDAYLVAGLLQLVDEGWKADANSFKPSYTKALERHLHSKIPNCQLKASPHIESRVKHIKRQYSAIKDMLGPNASGFGWDSATKTILVERAIYREWCKSHPTAVGLYGKPFPHYDSLDIVFGKDRATGTNAESPADAAFAMMKEFYQTNEGGEPEINLNDDANVFESQFPEMPTYNTTQGAMPMDPNDVSASRGTKRGRKKAKQNDPEAESLVNKFGEFCAGTVENIQQLTSCFLPEKQTADRRTQVCSMLQEIGGLSTRDVVRASRLITKDNNTCDCFFSMDTLEMKEEFVLSVLHDSGF